MKAIRIVALVIVVACAVAASAQGSCTNLKVAGTYSVTCSGWAPFGGALVPMMQVGTVTGDVMGNWSGSTTINLGGQLVIPSAPVAGQSNVRPDCTGSITYNANTPTEVKVEWVANLKTDEIFGVVTTPGTVASCVLKRMPVVKPTDD